MGVLVFMEEVFGIWKSWNPSAVFEFRVPADVIDVGMRAHNEVDAFWRHPHCNHFIKEGAVFHVPCISIWSMFMVTNAGIDNDRVLWCFDDVAVEAH